MLVAYEAICLSRWRVFFERTDMSTESILEKLEG
jgi:hypothetical protein